MYSNKGNIAFMVTISIAAVLSAMAIAFFGLNNISLAILIVLTICSIFLGKGLEHLFESREEKSFRSNFDNDNQ